jgi:hypothetical protein
MSYKKTLYKNSMVLISYEREGTILLLDVLAQLRKVKARVCEEKEDTIVLSGLVGDLQNPECVSFKSASGPRTIDGRGVVEDWVLEEEEEESTTIDIASVSTEPLEEEQEGEEADDVENQQKVENMTDVESLQDVEDGEALDWDAPEYVPTWLASLPSTPPSRVAQQAGTLLSRVSKTKHLRRSKRLQQRKRNQQLTAPAPWR